MNPAGVKGLGELGNVGTAPRSPTRSITRPGKRIRKLPIRIENVLYA